MKRINKSEYFVAKKIGRAINQYNMIEEGDKVLVGVSGGKDSLTLLRVLEMRKRWLPIDYTIKAVHVVTDYDQKPEVKIEKLEEYFKLLGCDYLFKEIAIAEKNKLGRPDCFWCSWNRRKAIFETASSEGCNKVAFGHHKDDIVETILMNMIFNGELSGINPVQSLFKGEIVLIRPLVFLEEEEIKRYVKELSIPEMKSTCPKNAASKRAVVKDIIARLAEEGQDIKSNIIRAPHRIKEEYLTGVLETKVEERFESENLKKDS